MEFLTYIATHGLQPLPHICTAFRAGASSESYLLRAVLGRLANDQADLLSDDDPLKEQLSDFASDAEEWLLAEFDALT